MRMDRFALPARGNVVLRNARIPIAACANLETRDPDPATGLATADIRMAEGQIASGPAQPADHLCDLRGRLVLPGFVDMHVHLDKAHTVGRTGLPSGGLGDAVRLSMADADNRDEHDLMRRMRFSLRCAHAHGTVAIRTHLDTPGMPAESVAWQVFCRLQAEWVDLIALQGVALMALERADSVGFDLRARQVAERGGVLGAFIAPGMAEAQRLDRFLEGAAEHDLAVDFHVDETLDPEARGLLAIAEAVNRTGFRGPVVAGHCCSLAAMPEGEALAVLDRVARAGIRIVSLPLTNLFLMDRAPGRTPRRRGLTLVHEMRARGIPVAFASDNVRDPFFPHGDFDMLEVLRSATRAAHLEARPQDWMDAGSAVPARMMGIDVPLIAPGRPADLVLTRARDWTDLLSRPQADRIVIRAGAPLPDGLPDCDDLELDREPA